MLFFFFLMIRRPPRSTLDRSSAASDVYKRQPQNFLFTLVETGQGDKNSKANFNGIISEKEFLTEGVYTNMDAGIIREASIGKRLWLDLNGNGIFSENEPGIEGVVVELYNENNTLLALSLIHISEPTRPY